MINRVIKINIKCFSLVSAAISHSELTFDMPEGSTASDALERVRKMNEAKLGALPIRVAVNQEYVTGDVVLKNDDEVALIPPVSGG
ncbi:MAG: MoaD/ThiS family protein [Chlorobiales bacterium]|jgi:molybdopterin converting factor small subunit|nr:MoaD/ThiS family protein [Chlorobiales bacterium]